MATRQDASRLRQQLVRTEEARDKHLQVLLETRLALMRGSFVVVGKKCGKSNCRCATGELHPTRYLSSSEEGRTRIRYVPTRDELRVREAADRYRRFREARAALARLSTEVLGLSDALEVCLTESYPPPTPGKGHGKDERTEEEG
jgi:hypothetical protein